jgi:hypothetical protein
LAGSVAEAHADDRATVRSAEGENPGAGDCALSVPAHYSFFRPGGPYHRHKTTNIANRDFFPSQQRQAKIVLIISIWYFNVALPFSLP